MVSLLARRVTSLYIVAAMVWGVQNMQCGEMVEVQGEPFIVSGVTYRYHIRNGRYEPSEKRLDVQGTGRYFLNLHLDTLLKEPRD